MSSYYENCESCDGCGGRCDKCTASCCLNNMNSHKELFKLSKEFLNKVSYAEYDVSQKKNEIYKKLYDNYNIYVYNSSSNDSFYDNLKSKYSDLQNDINNIDNQISNEYYKYRVRINELNINHNKNINNLNNYFNNKKKYYERIDEKEQVEKIKKDLENLENKKNEVNEKIKQENEKEINDFIKEETMKAENNYNAKTKEIDNQNSIEEEKLEYNEKEKKLRNQYLFEISKIKNVSDKIPNYNAWISMYELNKYVN
jgi:hypothetical protein